jgi:hypothetical protein
VRKATVREDGSWTHERFNKSVRIWQERACYYERRCGKTGPAWWQSPADEGSGGTMGEEVHVCGCIAQALGRNLRIQVRVRSRVLGRTPVSRRF